MMIGSGIQIARPLAFAPVAGDGPSSTNPITKLKKAELCDSGCEDRRREVGDKLCFRRGDDERQAEIRG